MKLVAKELRKAGVSQKTVTAIRTKALKTGRKLTGVNKTNRDPRWDLDPSHPQYGTELDCKIIFVKLCAGAFRFDGAPALPAALRMILEDRYLGESIEAGNFRDRLLLERFSFADLVASGLQPVAGHSDFHLGHEDPSLKPKHTRDNINWRTARSNLIQGDMTLRQARIYFLKMIGRYFELGELPIT